MRSSTATFRPRGIDAELSGEAELRTVCECEVGGECEGESEEESVKRDLIDKGETEKR